MFERFFNFFRRGGAKLGMVEKLNHITDHNKIGVKQSEYSRIAENERIYGNKFKDVEYINSHGRLTQRPFKSINVSKIVARKMAKLVFNEGVSIGIENAADNKFIQDIFDDSRFIKNFGEQLEAGYAIGGLVLRPYVDTSTGKIKISFIQADNFYPLETNTNEITEGAIAHKTVVTEGKKTYYYTLLEFHEWNGHDYQITNELYQSESDDITGIKVPLATLDKYADLEEVVELQNFTRPVFVYIKLAGRNNIDLDSPLSLGIIDNSKKQLIDINEKYDQFMWEVSEAGRKIVASDEFFKVRYDNNGRKLESFDQRTSVFHRMRNDEPSIDEFSPALRQDQFIETINFILRIIELQTGLSSGTFSFDGQSVKTATEVVSENSETYATRSDNILIVEQALKELIITIFDLAAAYDLHKLPQKLDINIDFDDGVFQSQESKLDYYGKATTYQLMPKTISMQKMYGISENEAIRWLKMINAEMVGADPLEQEQQTSDNLIGKEE